ncbi:Uncharacterised protein [Serratia fonticola]|uniref:Uncharacterized protein n=1 Tax=Serratia fonticola TaxID=47917 RepID=A0A4U9WAP0_SERFO|nr:Uncharacterised protein [Serratia fonticola]
MKTQVRLALIGDYRSEAVAHQASPQLSNLPPHTSILISNPNGSPQKP